MKEFGRINGVSRDAEIQSLITATSLQIEKYLGRGAEVTSRTEFQNSTEGQSIIFLSSYPVTSVDNLYIDSTWQFTTALDSDRYFLDSARGRVYLKSPLTECLNSIKVEYTGGMGTDESDFISNYPQIALACDAQVDFVLKRKTEGLGAVASSLPGSTLTQERAAQLLRYVRQILNPYRHMSYR